MSNATECELFKVRAEHDRKPASEHPWQRTIKSEYSHQMKHCHNSLRNPDYPKTKTPPIANRAKFTVIGNRGTKEFIYCSNLVRGICSYRRKCYEPPVIRGLTRSEWDETLRNLKITFGGLAHCLQEEVAVIYNNGMLGGQEELKNLIETKYIYHVCVNYRSEALKQFALYVKGSGRPCVYMHITIGEREAGTLIFMLYSDIVPRTCENFLRLCQAHKGGYSGTPVHRIVKDGWIQCGGFALKSTDLKCENFAVPHDRRGVLCMANDGRDLDCSTQFFVLLQPSPWMACKYVAFGQLIDGDATLNKIENIETFYESPKQNIVIDKSGILNLDCQDIKINKTAYSYIQGHIEDLVTIGELFWELLMEHVYLEIEFRRLAALDAMGEGEQEHISQPSATDMRETKRFIRRKDTIDRVARSSAVKSEVDDNDNNDFDVEDYDYDPEETYSHISLAPVSLPPKPEKLFYIPFTDVPYPSEVDSTYDLKKFLKGHYSLESDLEGIQKKFMRKDISVPVISNIFSYIAEDYIHPDEEELSSDDELEIKKYLRTHGERVSFAGKMVRGIAKSYGIMNLANIQQEKFSDECVRRVRLASIDVRRKELKVSGTGQSEELTEQQQSIKRKQSDRPEDLGRLHLFQKMAKLPVDGGEEEVQEPIRLPTRWDDDDKSQPPSDDENETYDATGPRKVSVSINVPHKKDHQSHIKRRQTSFVRAEDLAKVRLFQKPGHEDQQHGDDDTKPKVRIAEADGDHHSSHAVRRPTGYLGNRGDDEEAQARPSVMARLYENVAIDDDEPVPTLKDYKPLSETRNNNPIFLTKTIMLRDDEDEKKGKFGRPSIAYEEDSFDNILDMQQGYKMSRKISSDHVQAMEHIDRKPGNSLRTLEFAKTRPTLTIAEYQQKNQRAKELIAAEGTSRCIFTFELNEVKKEVWIS